MLVPVYLSKVWGMLQSKNFSLSQLDLRRSLLHEGAGGRVLGGGGGRGGFKSDYCLAEPEPTWGLIWRFPQLGGAPK